MLFVTIRVSYQKVMERLQKKTKKLENLTYKALK
jgi:hypothetical protein